MSKQSSIEWLWHNLTDDLIGDLPNKTIYEIYNLVLKAKQMHKEEIIKILNKREDYLGTQPSVFDYLTNEEWFEEYYQETYGGNNEQPITNSEIPNNYK